MTNRSPYGRHAMSQTAAMLILCLFFSASLPAVRAQVSPARRRPRNRLRSKACP